MADKNSINLGRVLPIYKGDWNADTNYDILDIVYYNGNSYTAKQPSINQEPKADSAYWGISSVKGQKGDKGDQGQKGDTGPQGHAGKDGYMPVIGGRNLLLGTGVGITFVGSNSKNQATYAYGLAGRKKVSDLYNQYGSNGYLTISFDWVASGDTISGILNPVWGDAPWGGLATREGVQPSSTNTSGHYENTVSLNAPGYSTGIATSIFFRQDNLQGNVTISNMKLEAGNVATDWTPAPEDIDSAIVNVQTTADNASTNVTNLKQKVDGLGQTNQLFNTEFSPDLQGWSDQTLAKTGIGTFNGSNILDLSANSDFRQLNVPLNGATVISASVYRKTSISDGPGARWSLMFYGDNNFISSTYGTYQASLPDFTLDKLENITVPSGAQSVSLRFYVNGTTSIYQIVKPMLVFDSTVGDYTPGNYYPKDDIQALEDHTIRDTGNQTIAGNKIIVGDNTYMGTNTFMDGVSLAGKNVVNGLTDTDWLDIPLAEGLTGNVKYKVSLGKVFVHIDSVKGVTGTGLTNQGTICSLPVYPTPFTTRYMIQSYNSTNSPSISLKQITIPSSGDVYVSNAMGFPMLENDSYMLDIVLM